MNATASMLSALAKALGEMDVADCVALTKASLQRFSAELDPKRGAAYGGSHGGYLTAWLLGCEDRDLYSCGVLWNPVVDLPAMLGTTDIPEWVAAEGGMGNEGVEWPITPEQLVNLHKRSPLSVIDKVSAPALMLLGAADQRVPHKLGVAHSAAAARGDARLARRWGVGAQTCASQESRGISPAK